MDITALQRAYASLLEAAATVGDDHLAPATGEWNADEILAHVSIVSAVTIAAAATVAAGANTTYENRLAQDAWTLGHIRAVAGGNAGLRDRIAAQGEALCALARALSDTELDTLVPTLLLSAGTVLVDQSMPLRDLITGLADAELPGHTRQLLALLPEGVMATAAA
ncbi:hypothetical protein [Nocardia coubleae]|uniref:DinB-like domain-containing protein n=1 Tax=Nocardia coubleae TaxID=356147 RepID=A0A846VZP0_9NOCA|nr:hypothetical protein [Nocardia coubleae]NKX86225.1 hypothetical protein [Nocardia coubleae]